MKKKIILLFFISSLVNTMHAHNFQSVNPNRTAFFEDEYGYIHALQIDSTKISGTDSIFYPFYIIVEKDDYCFSPKEASWIGSMVIVDTNGNNYFFNKTGDTIKIKTSAKKGETWLAFTGPDSMKVVCEITGCDTASFLGVKDSVKTIQFYAFNKDSVAIKHTVNTFALRLSKNYGWVDLLNFYCFPDFSSSFFNISLQKYTLSGLTNPELGTQNITWLDIHDYQPGDEIHIYEENLSGDVYGYSWYNTHRNTILNFLSRNDLTDKVTYKIARLYSMEETWSDSSSYKVYQDTINVTYKPYAIFDKLSELPYSYDDPEVRCNYQTVSGKIKSGFGNSFWQSSDDCWEYAIADGCLYDEYYEVGLGGPYYSCTNSLVFGSSERSLIYFKKGSST